MKLKNIILTAVIVLFVLIQFFQIDKTPPQEKAGLTFVSQEKPTGDVQQMLESACFDCHSYQTKYPWYTYIQPVGWWLRSHVSGARIKMNFSTWANYPAEERRELMEEAAEEIAEDEMPPKSFRLMHSEAKLTEDQKKKLIAWLNGK